MELRCFSGILHATADAPYIEVACKSKRCGKAPGILVLHTFNTMTGELVSTKLYREPKEIPDGNCAERSALRAS